MRTMIIMRLMQPLLLWLFRSRLNNFYSAMRFQPQLNNRKKYRPQAA